MVEEVPPDAVYKMWTVDLTKVHQSASLPVIPVEQPPIVAVHLHVVALPNYECDQTDGFSGGPGGKEETVMDE